MKLTHSFLLLSLVLSLATAAAAKETSKRPNVVLVLLDDLGYGQWGPVAKGLTPDDLDPLIVERAKKRGHDIPKALAAAKVATPTLCKLAEEGTQFSAAYVTNPLCSPSRAGLMTSVYPERFGGYVNIDIVRNGVPPEFPILAKYFQEAGYATAMIGKWHLSPTRPPAGTVSGKRPPGAKPHVPAPGNCQMGRGTPRHPLTSGFDYFYGFNFHGTDYYESSIIFRNYEPVKEHAYLTDAFTDESLKFIKERPEKKPFFLYLAYSAVHGPLGKPAPQKYLQKFKTGSKQVDNFYAYLNAADVGLGKILDQLAKQGEAENTLVVVLSDNGAGGGTPTPNNAPFTGFKGQLWQGGIHVPMVMWCPSVIPAGKVCDEPVLSLDIFPTAMALAGIKLPKSVKLDGKSLMPLLDPEKYGKPDGPIHETLAWAGIYGLHWAGLSKKHDEKTAAPSWCVRRGNFLLRYWSHTDKNELFDVIKDPGERNDLSRTQPERVATLKKAYAQWFNTTAAKPIVWGDDKYEKMKPK